MEDKQQARELYLIQQNSGYQKELLNIFKESSFNLNDMDTTKPIPQTFDENISEIKSAEYKKYLKEQMNKKKPKIFGVGSKFTKPKNKRKK